MREFRGFCSFFRGRLVETVLHLPAFTVFPNSGLSQHGVSEASGHNVCVPVNL